MINILVVKYYLFKFDTNISNYFSNHQNISNYFGVKFMIMRKDINSFYVGMVDNMAVIWDTNLMSFWKQLRKLEPKSRYYDYYDDRFKEVDKVEYVNPDGKKYVLQKII